MKTKIIKALKESLAHWEKNYSCFSLSDEEWFDENCQGDDCPLCSFFDSTCERENENCPLDDDIADERKTCCVEWQEANKAANEYTLTRNLIGAVRDRIKKELEIAEK